MDVDCRITGTLVLAVLLSACSGGDSNSQGTATATPAPTPTPSTLYQVQLLSAQSGCATDEYEVRSGPDRNFDSVLNESEVNLTETVCDGEPSPGQKTQLLVSSESPGTNCALGGNRVQVGIDANENGLLDVSEVSTTEYFCSSLSDIVAPFATIEMVQGQSFSGTLAASGITNVTYQLVTQPLSAELSIALNGTFTFTPAPSFYGTDSFEYLVLHNGVSTAQTISVEIAPAGDIPAIWLSPSAMPGVIIEQKQQASQKMVINNATDSDINFSIDILSSDSGIGAITKPVIYQSVDVAKGSKDKRIGKTVTMGRGGPDTFGYHWIDSKEPGGPAFDWIDIRDTGTQITGIYDDVVVGPFPIGFDFKFYGISYQNVYISSNGIVGFQPDLGNGCCAGQPLPSDDLMNNLIAWLWRDLYPGGGQVFYQQIDADRFVIQFEHYGDFSTNGLVTAEIIFHRNGDLLLQYLLLENGFGSQNYSIGIENADSSDGLQVAFNTPYLEDRLAVLIRAGADWITADTRFGTLPAGQSQEITLDYFAKGDAGAYNANLILTHDVPDVDVISRAIEMQVTPDQTPPPPITDLAVAETSFDQVTLEWHAVADQGFLSDALAEYEIRYSNNPLSASTWGSATLVTQSLKPKSPGSVEELTVEGLQPETEYYFGVRGLDDAGNLSDVPQLVSATTLGAPIAHASPLNIQAELTEGNQSVTAFELSNSGGSPLQFQVSLVEIEESVAGKSRRSYSGVIEPHVPQVIDVLPAKDTYITKEIIVRFKPQGMEVNAHALRQQFNAVMIKSIDALYMEVWQLSDGADMLQTIQSLNSNPHVIFAEPNYKLKSHATTDDSYFGDLWGLHNIGVTGGTEDGDIDAVEAWDIERGSRDVVVAVIDTGIDYQHTDLLANIWTNGNEISGNGIDDDNNGFVDDIHGYNFHDNNGDPMDGNGHGTHVAGTIGAEGNNGLGVVGVNHEVSLMAVRFLGNGGSGSTDDAVESIIYAVDNGASILNNSWGGSSYSEALLAAIEYAHEHGVLFVAAAGNAGSDNDTSPSYPANYEVANVISVAATDHNDELAAFSQYGLLTVHLGAPGVGTLSTIPNNGYDIFSGTSMATPHVAGAAALLQAHRPSLTNLDLKQLLLESVDPLDSLADRTISGGRLNIYSALLQSGPQWIQILQNFSGSLAPGENINIPLNFDSTDLAPGQHRVNMHLETNDPANPLIVIPVVLTVNPDTIAPASISDLMVSSVADTHAVLSFTATGDDGVSGRASSYDIRFSTTELTDANWALATQATGQPLPAAAGEPESFTLFGLEPNTPLWVGVRVVDNVGMSSDLSNVVEVTTLNADLQVSPNVIPPVTLAQGEVTTVDLTLTNIGGVDINGFVSVGSAADTGASFSTQYFRNPETRKGIVDRRVGAPVLMGYGGTDEYGHGWIDSNETYGPTYQWTDIAATGTPITDLWDDSLSGPYNIGFDFPFYGENQTAFFVSSNGFITFSPTSSSGCCTGQPLPLSDGIDNLIAWLWYDLHPRTGTVHYQVIDDKLIIQFTNYGEYSRSGTVDAQVVLSPDGTIMLQYKEFRDGMDTGLASVGIENHNGTDGLQVAFNTPYLSDELAIRISGFWLRAGSAGVDIPPAESTTVVLTIDAQSLAVGDYESEVIIRSNDSDQPEMVLPVTLRVTE